MMKIAVAMLLAGAALMATPQQGPAQGRPLPESSLTDLITAVRGTSPLTCELAVQSVENRWGWSWQGGREFRTSRDAGVRSALALIAERRIGADAIPVLRAALGDGDACVRRVASPLLGRIEDAGARTALRQALRSERAEVREAAAYGLGFSEDPAVIPALLAGLQDAEPRVRVAAAWALGEIEDRRAIGALVRLLREDRDPEVRAAAAWAIGAIEG